MSLRINSSKTILFGGGGTYPKYSIASGGTLAPCSLWDGNIPHLSFSARRSDFVPTKSTGIPG